MEQAAYINDEAEGKEEVKKADNVMNVSFLAIPENEQLARMLIASFAASLDPTLEELSDVKTAVSEAVTNAIIHGYPEESSHNYVHMKCRITQRKLEVMIQDFGEGIADIKKAMEPMYTSKPELERSGMGFAFMEAFMDTLKVASKVGEGTQIIMEKSFGKGECAYG